MRFLYGDRRLRLENIRRRWHVFAATSRSSVSHLSKIETARGRTLWHRPGCALQGASHDGRHHARPWHRFLRAVDRLRARLRPALKEIAMIFDYSVAGIVTLGLMIYLVYALLRPESL
jgi:K+-transporting ATPase KdpF subunit